MHSGVFHTLRFFLILLLLSVNPFASAEQAEGKATPYQHVQQLYSEGKFKDALDQGASLLAEGHHQDAHAAKILEVVLGCLDKLTLHDRFDELVETALKIHDKNLHLMAVAARGYLNTNHRATDGRRSQSWGNLDIREYDRLRALQLMDKALNLLHANSVKDQVLWVDIYAVYTDALRFGRKDSRARFRRLTNLQVPAEMKSQATEYELSEGLNEIPFTDYLIGTPASLKKASSDAERWRFLLASAIQRDGLLGDWGKFTWSQYLEANLGITAALARDSFVKAQLKTLASHESFYLYQDKIDRIKLPQGANFIELLADVARRSPHNLYTSKAAELLAQIYENRDRRDDALVYWRIAEKTSDNPQLYTEHIQQIIKPYGRFEPSANKTINYRFRNGRSVRYSLLPVDTKKLVEHLKNTALTTRSYTGITEEIVGTVLVKNKDQLLQPAAFEWRQALENSGNHEDAVIPINLPGAVDGPYLLVAELEGGNTTHLLKWQNQNILTSFPLGDEYVFYLADAQSGKPLPAQKIHFWSASHYMDAKRKPEIIEFSRKSNKDGWISVSGKRFDSYQWLVYSEDNKASHSFLNLSEYWYEYDDFETEEHMGVFFTTHQPVYRPGQTVKFKAWVRSHLADRRDISLAGMPVEVTIQDEEGNSLLEKTYRLDRLGGFQDELALPDEAALGIYDVYIGEDMGYDSFIVEEYKKPEFVVTIDKNRMVSQLTEKIRIPVSAQYYYGQPVRNAEIRYDISGNMSERPAFLQFQFDWLYDPDYAWFPETDLAETFKDDDAFWDRYKRFDNFHRSGSVTVDPATGLGVIEVDLSREELAQFPDVLAFDVDLTVTDESRRSVELSESVSFSKAPYQVYAWLDKGFYRAGESIRLEVAAQTSVGNSVAQAGELSLLPWNPADNSVILRWSLPTDSSGKGMLDFSVDNPGLYRLHYEQIAEDGQKIRAERKLRILTRQGLGAGEVDNELVFLKQNSVLASGGRAQFFVASNLSDQQSILLASPTGINGKNLIRVEVPKGGKALELALPKFDDTTKTLHAITVGGGKVFSQDLYVPMPPVDKFLNIEIKSDKSEYKPGEKIAINFRLKSHNGKPVKGELVVAVYDQALEPFAAALPEHYIESLFYKKYDAYEWGLEINTPYIDTPFFNEVTDHQHVMRSIGLDVEGASLYRYLQREGSNTFLTAPDNDGSAVEEVVVTGIRASVATAGDIKRDSMSAVSSQDMENFPDTANLEALQRVAGRLGGSATVRRNFLDSIYWHAKMSTDTKGKASARFTLPDNLTTWKIAVWAMADKTRVGQAKSEIRVNKPLVLRAQTPRFLVEEDEVTLSANIMNNSEDALAVSADIQVSENMSVIQQGNSFNHLKAQGEARVDWQVRALAHGSATVTMTVDGSELQDGVATTLPVLEKGQQLTKVFHGTLRDETPHAEVEFDIPARHEPDRTQLELDYSPYLIAPALKALPYLAGYPYGCTEQTLNRFLPSAIALHAVDALNLDLPEVLQRAPDVPGLGNTGTLDKKIVTKMIKQGMLRLDEMQNHDGGWDWFAGSDQSYVHTTAVVMHGLTLAKKWGVTVDTRVFDAGLKWLIAYQALRLTQLRPIATDADAQHPGNDDALVAYLLAENAQVNAAYLESLYQHSPALSHYGKVLLASAFHIKGDIEKRDAVHDELQLYIKLDDVNQTAYLQAQGAHQWWRWYHSDIETQAFYLMYLSKTDPNGSVTARVARYIANNRTHGNYWESTRDSALAVEALLEYFMVAQQRLRSLAMTATLDNQIPVNAHFNLDKESRTTAEKFEQSHKFYSDTLGAGPHQLRLEKQGLGELYYTAYLSYFSKEDVLPATQSDVGVQRRYYLLHPSPGSVEGYTRKEIAPNVMLKSGDLVEVELVITSANDYEYILIEDRKPAGFEALESRSGYKYDRLPHFVEYRDDRVSFFVRNLNRGEYRLTYKAKAEIPGNFTALPATIEAMYSPRLKGNSDVRLISIRD